MLKRNLPLILLSKQRECKLEKYHKRNVQVSVIGAANNLGLNVSLLLKQNAQVTRLKLYDDDPKVLGVAKELHYLPGGAPVIGFTGEKELPSAVSFADLILLVSMVPRSTPIREKLQINANIIHKVCKTMSDRNPIALLCIASNPINSMLPFASSLLHKYKCLNPFRVLGITQIDWARTRCFTAYLLQANPRQLTVPVIGGSSDETVVPLLSNIKPEFYNVDNKQAFAVTRLVKKADLKMTSEGGVESSNLALAWSIHDFTNKIMCAINGQEVEVHSFTANPNFGTRYFAGPTNVGAYGIIRSCSKLPMNDLETKFLNEAIPFINKDVTVGEELVDNY